MYIADVTGAQTITQRIQNLSIKHPNLPAQYIKDEDDNFMARSYVQLMTEIYRSAYFLKAKCRVKRGNKIAIISDNRADWLIFDLAILGLGAVDVPRGSDTVVSEIAYILEHSQSKGAIFEKVSVFESIKKIAPKVIEKLSFVIFIESVESSVLKKLTRGAKYKCFEYSQITSMDISQKEIDVIQAEIQQGRGDDCATIIYTSGTTAKPKGVCLSQKGFLFQIDVIVPQVLGLQKGHILLSVLPVWHAYEREIQYIAIGSGTAVAYSKPIGKILLDDIVSVNAHWMTSVPRIWEAVYAAIYRKVRAGSPIKKIIFNIALRLGIFHEVLKHIIRSTLTSYTPKNEFTQIKKLVKIPMQCASVILYGLLFPFRFLFDILVFKKIRSLLGKRFVAGISGGGALPSHVDWFFQAAKISVLEGYGLTEASPVLSVRKQSKPEANSIGKLFDGIEFKVVNPVTDKAVGYGNKGVLYVRSPQVMQGYYKDEKATREVLSKDAWLNTGDLVVLSEDAAIKIVGREKELIVLRSGENISPARIENELLKFPFIDNVMAVGQDQKYISVLITLHKDLVREYIPKNIQKNSSTQLEVMCKSSEVRSLVQDVINKCNMKLNVYERITRFTILPHTFEVGVELTQTLKLKRSFIKEKYNAEIQAMYK